MVVGFIVNLTAPHKGTEKELVSQLSYSPSGQLASLLLTWQTLVTHLLLWSPSLSQDSHRIHLIGVCELTEVPGDGAGSEEMR